MSRSDVIGGAAVPLADALPWSVKIQRTLLVNDSISADGRFLLYTLASQALAAKDRVLWLACGPTTPAQILQGLKKIGCDNKSGDLTVRSLTAELAAENFSEQGFLKQVYQSIQTWLDLGGDNRWILLDDATALASLLGERLVYGWILALNAKSQKKTKFGFLIRCSNDLEEESLPTFAGSSVGQQDWFGAATSRQPYSVDIPWERSLIEVADAVMDVLPLTSGYTRELQGRIVFSSLPHGRGWGDSSGNVSQQQRQKQQKYPAMQIINYGITDQKIVAYIM